MSEIDPMNVKGAAKPKGPYSPVVRAGDFLYVSGQGPINPETQQVVLGDIQAQTKLTLENVERALASCGASRKDIVKCGVFLAQASDFAAMNEAYAPFFGETRPARTTVQAGLVEEGMKIEIDCVAYLGHRS
jgi:2-iminobutanoate/2-iminopropanoate deaminase